jgi:hypothetical protein
LKTARTAFLPSGTSVFGPPSGYRIVTQPAHGSLTGVAPDLVYTPVTEFSGRDGFTFVAKMGAAESLAATVSIEVVPVDDPPVAQDLVLETRQGQPLSIRLSAFDADSSSLAFRVVEPPTAGELLPGSAQEEFVYSPRTGYTGEDGFAYAASDGTTESAPARVTIRVVSDAASVPDPDLPGAGAPESGCGCSDSGGAAADSLLALGLVACALFRRRRP